MVENTVRFAKYESGNWAWVADARRGEDGQMRGPVGKWETFQADIIKGGRRHGSGDFTAISDKDHLFRAESGTMVQIVMRAKDYENIPCRKAGQYQAICLQALTSPLLNTQGCQICLQDIGDLVKCYACKTVFSDLVEEELRRRGVEEELAEFRRAKADQEDIW